MWDMTDGGTQAARLELRFESKKLFYLLRLPPLRRT